MPGITTVRIVVTSEVFDWLSAYEKSILLDFIADEARYHCGVDDNTISASMTGGLIARSDDLPGILVEVQTPLNEQRSGARICDECDGMAKCIASTLTTPTVIRSVRVVLRVAESYSFMATHRRRD